MTSYEVYDKKNYICTDYALNTRVGVHKLVARPYVHLVSVSGNRQYAGKRPVRPWQRILIAVFHVVDFQQSASLSFGFQQGLRNRIRGVAGPKLGELGEGDMLLDPAPPPRPTDAAEAYPVLLRWLVGLAKIASLTGLFLFPLLHFQVNYC